LAQKRADRSSAPAAGGGHGKRERRLLHPSNARAFVLQLGALAGAILSIVAVAKLVLPGDEAPSKPVPRHGSPRVTLALANENVRVTTLRDYLRSIGADPGSEPSPDLDARGFSAPYTLNVRGYRPGSTIRVRFEVWRQTPGGDRYAVPPTWDHLDVDRDPDRCTCASTFIQLPSEGRYRLVIGVFPPGTRESNPGNPLKSVETEFRNSVSRT
jgi:hypothetical protein